MYCYDQPFSWQIYDLYCKRSVEKSLQMSYSTYRIILWAILKIFYILKI